MILQSKTNRKLYKVMFQKSIAKQMSLDKSYTPGLSLHNQIVELHGAYKFCRIDAYKNEQWTSCFAWTVMEWKAWCFVKLFSHNGYQGASIGDVLDSDIKDAKILDSGRKQITRVLKKCGFQDKIEDVNNKIEQSFRSSFAPLLPSFDAKYKNRKQLLALPTEKILSLRGHMTMSAGEIEELYFHNKEPEHYDIISSVINHSWFLESLSPSLDEYLQDTKPTKKEKNM